MKNVLGQVLLLLNYDDLITVDGIKSRISAISGFSIEHQYLFPIADGVLFIFCVLGLSFDCFFVDDMVAYGKRAMEDLFNKLHAELKEMMRGSATMFDVLLSLSRSPLLPHFSISTK